MDLGKILCTCRLLGNYFTNTMEMYFAQITAKPEKFRISKEPEQVSTHIRIPCTDVQAGRLYSNCSFTTILTIGQATQWL